LLCAGEGCWIGVGDYGGCGRRTDGVRGLHLQGDGLARHCAQSVFRHVRYRGIEARGDIRVFTKICMSTVVLDLDRVGVDEAGLPM
jgi:hypothetical protein